MSIWFTEKFFIEWKAKINGTEERSVELWLTEKTTFLQFISEQESIKSEYVTKNRESLEQKQMFSLIMLLY